MHANQANWDHKADHCRVCCKAASRLAVAKPGLHAVSCWGQADAPQMGSRPAQKCWQSTGTCTQGTPVSRHRARLAAPASAWPGGRGVQHSHRLSSLVGLALMPSGGTVLICFRSDISLQTGAHNVCSGSLRAVRVGCSHLACSNTGAPAPFCT